MNRAIKFRIYPTKLQIEKFIQTFGCCRKVWNLMLADKIKSYKESGKFCKTTPAMYKEDYPYLKQVDSLALANVQLNLQAAFKNCFDKSRKKNNRFPKFKSIKHSKKSYTTNNQNGSVSIMSSSIKLPKIGLVKAVLHRLPEKNWYLKSATVSQDLDGKWYISVLFEFEKEVVKISNPSKYIGLDYKSDGLFMDSDGNIASEYKFYRQNQKKLAKAQRKLARKVGYKKNETKSNNYFKQLKKVNKIHCHIKNCRKDFLHKKSTEIANQYDMVAVENLDMKALSNKGFHNGKATMDNGYDMFLNMLEYKLDSQGKYFIKIDKWYPSSQICSKCGNKQKLSLADRVYKCQCGNVIDRDLNAAINIKNEGLRLLNAV